MVKLAHPFLDLWSIEVGQTCGIPLLDPISFILRALLWESFNNQAVSCAQQSPDSRSVTRWILRNIFPCRKHIFSTSRCSSPRDQQCLWSTWNNRWIQLIQLFCLYVDHLRLLGTIECTSVSTIIHHSQVMLCRNRTWSSVSQKQNNTNDSSQVSTNSVNWGLING